MRSIAISKQMDKFFKLEDRALSLLSKKTPMPTSELRLKPLNKDIPDSSSIQ